ncbi:hypothetical protein MTO96_031408 [Rhipicephalus appendiculatus]
MARFHRFERHAADISMSEEKDFVPLESRRGRALPAALRLIFRAGELRKSCSKPKALVREFVHERHMLEGPNMERMTRDLFTEDEAPPFTHT